MLVRSSVVENMGLVRLGRGVISKKLQCLHVAIATFGLDLSSPRNFVAQWACLSSSCTGGFCCQKVTLVVLRAVGSQEKDFLFLGFE